MNDTEYILENTFLLSRLVAGVNINLEKNLEWLQKAYPLTQRASVTVNNTTFRYPVVYKTDSRQYFEKVAPDARLSGFSFFEQNGPMQFVDQVLQPSFGRQLMTQRFSVSLIFWVNLSKINIGKDFDYTDELIADVLNNANMRVNTDITRIENMQVETRNDFIFSLYDYDQTDKQYLLYPYSAFRINMDWITVPKYC